VLEIDGRRTIIASTLVVVVAFLRPLKLCELDPRLSHFEQEFLVRQIADLMRHT
jgi:hypothetical protein